MSRFLVVATSIEGCWATLLLSCGHEVKRRASRSKVGDPASPRTAPKSVKKCEHCAVAPASTPTIRTIPLQFTTPTRSVARVTPTRKPTMRVDLIQGGRTLRQHNHNGQMYFETPADGEYQIQLHNNTGRRRLVVLSVDGINVIDAENAGYDGAGYVVGAYQRAVIKGFRRSDTKCANFTFGTSQTNSESYVAQTGRGPANVGVIGVAVFDEKREVRPQVSWAQSTPISDGFTYRGGGGNTKGATFDGMETLGRSIPKGVDASRSSGEAGETLGFMEEDSLDDDSTMCAMPAACAASLSEETTTTTRTTTRTRTSAKMGDGILRREVAASTATKYGREDTMYTTDTTFKRSTTAPVLVTTFRYGTRAKLVEWGVPLAPDLTPNAFPASSASCPAPPGWRG